MEGLLGRLLVALSVAVLLGCLGLLGFLELLVETGQTRPGHAVFASRLVLVLLVRCWNLLGYKLPASLLEPVRGAVNLEDNLPELRCKLARSHLSIARETLNEVADGSDLSFEYFRTLLRNRYLGLGAGFYAQYVRPNRLHEFCNEAFLLVRLFQVFGVSGLLKLALLVVAIIALATVLALCIGPWSAAFADTASRTPMVTT
jgi:hypothetical protein